MKAHEALAQELQNHFTWDKRRIDFLSKLLIVLIKVRTVNLSVIATSFIGKAEIESHYKRLQRFFREFILNL